MGSKIFNFALVLITIACIAIGVFCGQKVYKRVKTDKELIGTYEKIKKDVKSGQKINWTKLKKVNPDVIAWIKVKDTKIDYPVVQGENNHVYLHKNIYGANASGGCIFLDSQNSRDFKQNDNSIFYGHHMRNGTMFADLMKFRKKDFAKAHTIDIFTPTQSYRLKAFSVYAKSAEKLPITFKNQDKKSEYLSHLKKLNSVNGLAYADDTSPILTLATCSYEGDDYRTYVHCQLRK